MRPLLLLLVLPVLAAPVASSSSSGPPASSSASPNSTMVDPTAGVVAFLDVAKVLQSPRCMNCHPAGDVPLVGEQSEPHAMEVSRELDRVGMSCQTCHRSTAVNPVANTPPAVAGWDLPPKAHPMVFQGRTPSQLCEQLKDPAQNGGKDLAALVKHVEHDALVLHGWKPAAGRSPPPLPHDVFVARFKTWVESGAPCPTGVAP